jgi:hypothetical protein
MGGAADYVASAALLMLGVYLLVQERSNFFWLRSSRLRSKT